MKDHETAQKIIERRAQGWRRLSFERSADPTRRWGVRNIQGSGGISE